MNCVFAAIADNSVIAGITAHQISIRPAKIGKSKDSEVIINGYILRKNEVIAVATAGCIGANATHHSVVASATTDIVCAVATEYYVITVVAIDVVTAITTLKRVIAVATIDKVVAVVAVPICSQFHRREFHHLR